MSEKNGGTVESIEELNHELTTVKGFSYLGDMMNVKRWQELHR